MPPKRPPTDKWVRAKLAASKDKATIEAGSQSFVALKQQANLELAKSAKAKVV